MERITSGISQIGGKYRLLKEILKRIPYHEFYLEPFLGSAIVLLNKPRCRYECGNDLNSELINYFLTIRKHPKEFDQLKQGVFGLVSHEICNRIVRGELIPSNNIERAYFFYYLNKLTFGEDAKQEYQYKMKKSKDQYNATIKGINPKTTRPFTNNDCGLLSPLNPKAIKRLRYVNLTCYPFDKVYKMFYDAFHVRKGLGSECFVYFDPPYPGTEKYYKSGFGQEEHDKLITIIKESPFHVLLSIGRECEQYVEELKDMIIIPVDVKYSTDANSQKKSREYLIMNYDINELPLMTHSVEQNTIEKWLK